MTLVGGAGHAAGAGSCVPAAVQAGQPLSAACSRKGAPGTSLAIAPLPGTPGDRLVPRPEPLPPADAHGQTNGDVFHRHISNRMFVPEMCASPAASHAATRAVAAEQKHFPLHLFFY